MNRQFVLKKNPLMGLRPRYCFDLMFFEPFESVDLYRQEKVIPVLSGGKMLMEKLYAVEGEILSMRFLKKGEDQSEIRYYRVCCLYFPILIEIDQRTYEQNKMLEPEWYFSGQEAGCAGPTISYFRKLS